jgi:glyoxylase-like metal-dependent hydrolase (beta-lactamase superfamily II)
MDSLESIELIQSETLGTNMSDNLTIHTLPVSPFAMNCYIISCKKTKEAVIIDAGDEPEKILSLIKQEAYQLKSLINTHAHVDHTSAVASIQESEKVPFYMHEAEKMNLDNLPAVQKVYGFGDGKIPKVDGYLKAGDQIEVGEVRLSVIETPGHTAGGICFQTGDHIFVGDTLFAGSIGRTDLPGGDYPSLIESIKQNLFTLSDDIKVHCGHGPETTLGHEKRHNPFFK